MRLTSFDDAVDHLHLDLALAGELCHESLVRAILRGGLRGDDEDVGRR